MEKQVEDEMICCWFSKGWCWIFFFSTNE